MTDEYELIPPLPKPNSEEWKKRIYYERVSPGEYIAYDALTGKAISATRGLMELYGQVPQKREQWAYHEGLIDHICDQMVLQNKPLSKLLRENKDLPPLPTIMRWKRRFPVVEEKLEEARMMLAEQTYEQIHSSAMEGAPDSMIELGWEKLKFDKLKFLAGVDSPARFGNRTQITGDKKAPVSFVISTGIDRGGEDDQGQGIERKQRICGDGGDAEGGDHSGFAGGNSADEEED